MQKLITNIHLSNLRKNALAFRRLTESKLCAVVKADAYGHGAIEVVNALYTIADFFAVALVEEGLEIRSAAAEKDVLVFTPPTCEKEAVVAIRNQLVLTVADVPSAKLIALVCKRYDVSARVHIKVNTGMNRYGVNTDELSQLCRYLKRQRHVRVQGIFSHLYTTDEATCHCQRREFENALAIAKQYFSPLTAHLAATYGATLGKAFAYDAVRIGLGLYGYTPVPCPRLALLPVMRAYALCVGTRIYRSGGVGYGASANVVGLQGKRISLLRAGYGDGIGLLPFYKALPLLNRCCMDVSFVRKNVGRGKEVALFSSAQELADAQGTIVYETLCCLGMRAERRYKDE